MLNVRKDFPILSKKINGKDMIYFDNAATTQKPSSVIDSLSSYYSEMNSNIHRGVNTLAYEATEAYENSRKKISEFINSKEQLIFTKNSTEGLNLIANSFKNSEVVLTEMEHHSNIVPWQLQNCKLSYAKITDYSIDMEDLKSKINKNTKIVSLCHVSNVLGTLNNVKEITKIAHENDALVVLDGAQSVPHMEIDVNNLDIDFMVFSGHKMMGPMGVGCLYGKTHILEEMNPFLGGGDMIKKVEMEKSSYNDLPWKFEAGTPNVGDVIALGSAVDYINKIGMKNIELHGKELAKYILDNLNMEGLKIFSNNSNIPLFSFSIDGIHPHDVSSICDQNGIIIRSGHHCAQILMEKLGVESTSRISLYVYNTKEEIDTLIDSLKKIKEVFK